MTRILIWSIIIFSVSCGTSCSKGSIDDVIIENPSPEQETDTNTDPKIGDLTWKLIDDAMSTHVHFGIGDNAIRRITLYMNYTGDPNPDALAGTFDVVSLKTNAVVGEQVLIPNGKTTTILSNSTTSEPIHIDIDPTKINGYETLTLALCVTNNGDAKSASGQNEFQIKITKIPDVLITKEVILTSPGNNNGHRVFDVADLTPYTMNEAHREPVIQQKIDFGCWNSENVNRRFTLIVPTNDDRLNAWGSGQTVRDTWVHKNDGILMKVPANSVTPALFDELNTPNQLLQSFDDVANLIGPLDSFEYGPGGHVHNIQEGELIFFRSLSRNIHAVAKVTEVVSGGSGSLTLLFKTVVEPY